MKNRPKYVNLNVIAKIAPDLTFDQLFAIAHEFGIKLTFSIKKKRKNTKHA